MGVWWCGVWMGLISYPLSPCGGDWGGGCSVFTGRSCTHTTSLTCSQKGNEVWREWKKGMCPSSNVKHQVTGSGQEEAFEDDPLLPVLGWTRQSIQAGQGCGEGSQVPPEGPGVHADLIWAKRTMESAGGSASVLPGSISVQTARVDWLHPNRPKNTDNSLVHNKLNRHSLPMKTLGWTYPVLSNLWPNSK